MKPVYFLCFSLFLMVLPTEILSADQKSASSDLVTKACQDTPHKDYCNTILRRSNVKDINDIIEILLKTAKLQARNAAKRVKEMSGKTPEDIKKLKNCVTNFEDAAEQSRDALRALDNKRYPDILEKITSANKDAATCVDSFGTGKKAPGQVTPMSDVSQEFVRTCGIATSITSKLSGKKSRR
ncbi:hypothetical protein ACFE04_003819 [Oxalis oulophora]